jgi:hypothetical protein
LAAPGTGHFCAYLTNLAVAPSFDAAGFRKREAKAGEASR